MNLFEFKIKKLSLYSGKYTEANEVSYDRRKIVNGNISIYNKKKFADILAAQYETSNSEQLRNFNVSTFHIEIP